MICNRDSNWQLLQYVLSKPHVFRIHDTTQHLDVGPLYLIISMLSCCVQIEFRIDYRKSLPMAEPQSEQLPFNGEAFLSHFVCVLDLLIAHGLHVAEHEQEIVTKLVLGYALKCENEIFAMALLRKFVEEFGFDVQHCEIKNRKEDACKLFHDMRIKQAQRWRVADLIARKGSKLVGITSLIVQSDGECRFTTAKYAKGRSLLHVAALHNRVDVMQWLLSNYPVDLRALDSSGDSVLVVCRKAGASAAEWFVVTSFACQRIRPAFLKYLRRKRQVKLVRLRARCALAIQSAYRASVVFRRFQPFLKAKRGSWERFQGVWGRLIRLLDYLPTNRVQWSWSGIKLQYDLLASEAQQADEETCSVRSLMHDAASVNLSDVDIAIGTEDKVDLAENDTATVPLQTVDSAPSLVPVLDHIELSQSVVKWLGRADARYRAMFQSRIARLAEGDRSYSLSKRLQHCHFPVFETKLDDGQRILWTELRRGSLRSILVSWMINKALIIVCTHCFLSETGLVCEQARQCAPPRAVH